MKNGIPIVLAMLLVSASNAVSTPKTEKARYQIFRSYSLQLSKQLGMVEIACAGEELPTEGNFKFCGIYKGDYFSFVPKWQKYASQNFTEADRPWIQSGLNSFSGEAAAKANRYWTFFGDFKQQTERTAFVSFGMYTGLEEH